MNEQRVTQGLQEDGTFVIDDRERAEWLKRYLEIRRRVEEQKPELTEDNVAPEPALTHRP